MGWPLRSCIALAGATLVVVSVACSRSPSAPPATRPVRFAGSGTCQPLVRLLMDEYVRANPGVSARFLPGTHSVGAVKALAGGLADIGMVSRQLKQEEKTEGTEYALLSNDGLALAAHPGVSARGLTTAQVREVYGGKITDWSEVGGARQRIVVLDRNEDESAKLILRQYVLGKGLEVTPKAVLLYYESDMVDALEKTPGAIGYFSLGEAVARRRKVRLLLLDGVEPTVESVLAGRHRVVRPLGLIYRSDISGDARAALDYLLSDAAARLMESKGYAPARR